jgi:phosphoglycolate phosphatase
MPAPPLILFDIDGTLVRRAGPHHREALVEAVRAITGYDTTTDHIPVQGMLDRDIITWMLKDAGVKDPAIRKFMPAIIRRAQWVYSRRLPETLRDKVCPGVVDVLKRLRQDACVVGIVSGNLSAIGWKKMQRAGLRRYFRFGTFAEEGRTRGDLVRIAIQYARLFHVKKNSPISLIGDHPNDVMAAKQNGVRSVAVATGIATRDELSAYHPDVLVDDLCALNPELLLR